MSQGSDMNVTRKQFGTGPRPRPGHAAKARRWFPAAAVRRVAAVLLAACALLVASQSNAQTTPSVTISAASERVEEGVGIVLTATLSQALAAAHTVPVELTNEYCAVTCGITPPSEFSFAANGTSATAVFETDDDGVEGGARQVTFTLEPTSDVQLGTPWSVSVWVDDNDAPPGAPRNLTARPGVNAVLVEWDPPAYTSGGTITKYEYRQSSNDGVTWHPGWIDAGLSTHKTVTGLNGGTEYTFEVRAVSSTAGDGARAQIKGTPFDLAGAGFDMVLSSATVVEGGTPVTATVRTGNGRTFPGLLSLTISWGADVINETDLLQVAGVANPQFFNHVDLPPHTSSVTFQVEAQTSDDVYRPPARRMLRIEAGGVVLAETPLTLMDDEPVPVATLSATATTATTTVMSVMEGEEFDLNVFLSQEVHPDFADEPVHMTVTGDTGALTGTLPTSATIDEGETVATQTVTTDGDTDHGGARTVTFTLTRSPQSIYTLGDPSSWTMTVLDNDAPPGAPRNLAAYAGDTKATLAWEAPADHGDTAITKFQYRSGSDVSMDDGVGGMTTTFTWGSWTDVPGGDGSTRTVEVSSLTNDTEYTFEVRAVNTNGESPESNQAMATPASTAVAVTWELSLSSGTIRQGGADVMVIARIATGPAFDADQSILVIWDDCWIGANQDINLPDTPCVSGHVRGRGEGDYTTWLVVPAGKRSGTLTLTAPPRNDHFDEYYAFHYDTELVATLNGTEIGREPLTWADAAAKPDLTLEASRLEVVEGEAIDMKLALSGLIANSHPQVRINVTDADSVLERPLPGNQVSALVRWFNVKNSVDFTLQSKDSTAVNGARAVTVELSHNDDRAPYYYDLAGGPVTVSVLDRDTRASAPQNFKAEPANGAVVLTWTAPATNGAAVEKYRYRESTDGGTNYGSWTDIPDSDADTTSYRVMGRTNGSAYTYQVQAFNRSGGGAESAAATATPMGATWGITLAVWPVMGPADDLTKIVEGGLELRVTLRSTNSVTFSADQTFEVFWNDKLVDADNLVRGNATTIIVSAGQTLGGSVVVRAPNDPEGETVYRPDTAARLSVRHGGEEVAGTPLTLVDNDDKPTVTLRLQNPRALENRAVAYFADLSGKISQEVRVTAEVSDDPDASLVNNDSVDFRFPAGARTAEHTIGIPQDTIVNGARSVTVTLTSNHADSAHYLLGEPTALTASVVDDDVLPDKPTGLAAEAGSSQVTLTWDDPTGPGGIQRYQYSVKEAGGSFDAWTNVPGGAGARSLVVHNLKIGTEYTFKLRARNRKGIGPESDEVDATPISGRDWLLEVAPGTLTEGGGDVTATVSFAGAVFDTDQVVGLEFGGEAIGGAVAPGSLIGGENAATYVTIARGATSGTLFLSPARADDTLFSPPAAFQLAAVHGGVTVATTPLALVDDEAAPEVSLSTPSTTVTEGDNIEVKALLSGPSFAEATDVVFNTADPAGALSSTPAGAFEFTSHETRNVTLTYGTTDNTSADGPVEVDFTLAPRAGAYALGVLRSVRVTVLDDDSKPGAPEGLTAGGTGASSIGLGWDAPTKDLVTRYEYRRQAVGGPLGAWTQIDDSGEGGVNRTGFNVTGLTAEPHDFWLRAVNGNGAGPPAGPVRAASVVLTWTLEVTSTDQDGAGNPQVLEGVDSLTVTARLAQLAPSELTVKLLWDGTEVGGDDYPGSLLKGASSVDEITVSENATSGQITLRGRQDDLYLGRIAGLLEARYSVTEVGTGTTVSYLDDEPVPVASIAAAPTTVTEGDATTVTVTTTQAAMLDRAFALDITNDSVLTSAAASVTAITVPGGDTTASQSYATDNPATVATAARSVVFALVADASGLRQYDLDAAASSATVVVLEDDATPAPPAGLVTAATDDTTSLALIWDPPTIVEVDAWQVRHREKPASGEPAWQESDWGDVTPTTALDGRLQHTVENLTAGVVYFFQVRGRNQTGNGDASQTDGQTVDLEWEFTVTSVATDGNPVVVEGGASLVVKAEMTSGGPLDDPQKVYLFWDGTPVGGDDYPGSLLEYADGADSLLIEGGATEGQVTVSGRQDNLYASREKAAFEGRYADAKIDDETVLVSYKDDEPVPVASVAAAPATVTEGDATAVTVTTTQAAVLDRAVALDITDDEPVLTSTAASVTAITVPGGDTTASQSYATVGDSATATAERSVVFALEADASGLGHYALDPAASSATVAVLDDDVVPKKPGRLRASPSGQTQMTLSWDPPTVVEVETWQVRHRVAGEDAVWNDSDWAGVTPTTGAGDRLEHPVADLTVGVIYDFQVRGQNPSGNGAEATATASTVVLEWQFTVTSPLNVGGGPQVVEGGASLTVRAEILSGAEQLDGDQHVRLFWGGTEVAGTDYPGSLLEGAGGEHFITIPDGQTSGQITVSGRQDNLYASREAAVFEGRYFGTKIDDETVSVSYLDDESVPVALIAAAPSRVTEGNPTSVTVRTTQAALLAREFALDITDDDGVLTTASASLTSITLNGGQTSASQGYTTQNVSGAQTAERAVVFALEADASGLSHYTLDPAASSAAVAVLDDDAAPAAPADLFGVGGNDRITLSWPPPPVQAVTSYEYQYKVTGTTQWGSWTTITLDGVQRPGGLVGFTKTGLTAGESYDFKLRGRNANGPGGEVGGTFPTIVIEWRFTASKSDVQEGSTLTATATITNASGNSDLPLANAITIPLTWCGEPLGDNPLLRGENGAKGITIAANSLIGTLTIEAPSDASDAEVFHPSTTCQLVAEFAGEAYSVALTRSDRQFRPTATIVAEPEEVTEGESIDVTVTLTLPFGGDGGVVLLAVEDADSALAAATSTAMTFGGGIAEQTFTAATTGIGTVQTAARTVVFELQENPDFPHYGVGAPSSATVRVLDQDAAPAAPEPLSGEGHDDGTITLDWTPPPAQAVTHYEYRYILSTGTTTWGSWTQVTDSGPGGANRTSVTVTGLTIGKTYNFQVRGENAAGKGAEANVTVSTVELEWSFSVSSGEVEEGRASLRVQASIINNKTAPVELEVELFWGGIPIGGSRYPGAALEGANDEGVHVIKIAQGQSSGELQVRGRDDDLYFPQYSHELEGRIFGGKIDGREVSYHDNELVPVLSIEADYSCPEGIGCRGLVTATQGSVEKVDFDVTVTEPLVVEEYQPLLLERGQTERPVYFYPESESVVQSGRRQGTLTLTADESGLQRWRLGTSSASVWILDDDRAPLRPQNLRASPGVDQVTLTWDRPREVAVDGYQMRYRESGAEQWGGNAIVEETTEDGRLGITVTSLVSGTAHQFRLWGTNTQGGVGEEATVNATTRGRAPSRLSVADTEVDEEMGATADFAVTLDRSAQAEVTVDYTTEDVTAVAGSDYTAVSGTLTFAPGETAKTVSVTVLDDIHNDEGETFKLVLSNPSGARIADAEGIATIHNSDPIPAAWLARFGRTVANHVVEAVRNRMSSVPAPSRRVTLGGAELKEPPAPEITQASPWDELVPEDQRPENLRSLRMREFLLSSSFELPLAQNATQDPGPGWTAWGGAAQTRFSGRDSGRDSEVSIDGDVTTATLGVDRAWDRVLLGLALARSTGDGSYSTGDIRGDLKSSITSAHPYLRFSLSDRLSAWTLLGYGKGELTLTLGAGEERTDIEMKMAALGARGALLASGGFDISARTDALLVRTSSEKTSQMAKTEADVSRLRLVLEGSRSLAFASGSSLTPSVEVGVRRDGGDAERGVGFEVGGAMRYANPSIGLTVEITARRLMAHEQSGYSEWGAGGSLQFAPGGAERGFSARLGSSVGTATSGVEGLWTMGDMRGLAGGGQIPGRVDAEAGYAMGAFGGSGVITPYGGFSMSGDRRYRAGWRLSLGDSFNLSLEGDRAENPDSPSRHGVTLRGDLRW